MKKLYRLLVTSAGVLMILITVLVILSTFWSFRQVVEATEDRKNTFGVISQAHELFNSLLNAETGQRGYQISGSVEYLEPFFEADDRILIHLEELHHRSFNHESQNIVKGLAPLVIRKLEVITAIVNYYKEHNTTIGLKISEDGTGRKIMDDIRDRISDLIENENGSLRKYDSEVQYSMTRMFIVIIIASLLIIIIASIFTSLIYRDTQGRFKILISEQTQHLLDIQESANKELQLLNINLQISEERFAVTLNSIGDAVLATDIKGNITLINPLGQKLTGWTQEDAYGRPAEEVFCIINQKSRRPAVIPIRETLEKGTVQGLINHVLLVSRDGTERDIADSCAPIRNRAGLVVGSVMVFRDISERTAIEAGLEKTRKELEVRKLFEDEEREYSESIINTIREPLIALDHSLRVVTANRSFYEVFKVKSKDTLGELIYDLGNKQWDILKLRELLETILPEKTSFDNYEVDHDFTNIGRRIMLLNARQIHRALGKEKIILLAIEDITKRKESENGLEKAHEELNILALELARVARVKSEFLANMSHELRTPLNSINGFSEVLFDETFGVLNEKQKKYVGNVLTSGKHLLLLINQILDMAKVESGKMKLELSKLNMKALLTEIAQLVADMAGKKRIEMRIEIDDNMPSIDGDELKVKEIIYNLISNAVKFTPEGGKLGMQAKRVDSSIEIVVWDNGVGIAEENMEKIFEGFFRVDTPYSRVTEGTGLGLPLSKKLVELHGGKFAVESQGLGNGTTIRFTLPIISGEVI